MKTMQMVKQATYVVTAVISLLGIADAKALELTASRSSGISPLSVHLSVDGPLEDSYEWDFGDGSPSKRSGRVEGKVFHTGSYTVTARRLGPNGNTLESATTTLNVTAFNGTSIYVNSVTGNDANSCLTPSAACRTISRLHAVFNAVPSKSNIRVLFARGSVFDSTPSPANLLVISHASSVRIGAYANLDGSDNPTLAKPIFRDHSGTQCSASYNGNLLSVWNSDDVYVSDIVLQGHYQLGVPVNNIVFGNPACRRDHAYDMDAISSGNTNHFTLHRVEVKNLGIGVLYHTSETEYPFIVNSEFSTLNESAVMGNPHNAILVGDIFKDTTNLHTFYWGPQGDSLISDTQISGGGTHVLQDGVNSWLQCTLRFNESMGVTIVQNTKISGASGAEICTGGNSPTPLARILFRNNFIDGRVDPRQVSNQFPANLTWQTAVLTSNGIFQNNVFVLRGPIEVRGQVSAYSVNEFGFRNNTIFSSATQSPQRALVLGSSSGSGSSFFGNSAAVSVRNNIVYGAFQELISVGSDVALLQGLQIGRNIINKTNGAPTFRVGSQTIGTSQWQTLGFDTQSMIQVEPQFESVDPFDVNFARIKLSSPAVNSGETGVLEDFGGRRRDSQPDIGASEYIPATEVSVSGVGTSGSPIISVSVQVPQSFVGSTVTIVIGESPVAGTVAIPFANGLALIPGQVDQALVRSVELLTGQIGSSGTFTRQLDLGHFFAVVPEEVAVTAVIYQPVGWTFLELSETQNFSVMTDGNVRSTASILTGLASSIANLRTPSNDLESLTLPARLDMLIASAASKDLVPKSLKKNRTVKALVLEIKRGLKEVSATFYKDGVINPKRMARAKLALKKLTRITEAHAKKQKGLRK